MEILTNSNPSSLYRLTICQKTSLYKLGVAPRDLSSYSPEENNMSEKRYSPKVSCFT